ncbi:LOW QUALITY PROTEIN: regulator of telomere elongation helicase 1 [Pseudochaenichthys georgianus]|uniref:LOW QUALITY PROTEIN: regulator of telomere elongation helicase 1 n=1 Tax=Pseudochaenichthys georgianus TaxID=52239 RepID=UPI00146F3054|nr:LOW QUALITY PROTEIN: regulator of telomere elongation helicase 1 [Pseudochaenichthys georgianus]
MTSLTLKGVTVNFPFVPYDCQKDYMSKVIECLQEKANGVLESPTGTGKTLCLLCATLAWRERFKDTISARKVTERLKGEEMFSNTPLSSWGTAATDGDTPTHYTDVPKIIYASRTHSQLAQVIKELKNTSYKPKVCVLGSREQLCINPEVMKQQSNHVKVHSCRAKVSTRSCVYYNNVEEKSTDKELVNSVLDVEDLVKFGNKQRVCPYYLSRSLKQQADIVFTPYNYLLDPKSRRAHNIELNGAVVIFDEAHNVEKTCEESTSFDLTPYDVASAITAVDRLLAEQAKEASHGDTVSDFNVESLNAGFKLELSTIAKIKQILLDLEAVIDSYDVPNEGGITKPGLFIYELLERAHLTYSSKTAVQDALEQITGYLAGQPGVFVNTSGLQQLTNIIQLVFCGEPSEQEKQQQMETNTAHFKVHIHQDTSHQKKAQGTDVWASASKKQGNILSYWCFSPGYSMQSLVDQGVRCIILTSGTLSPLSSFTSEMRIKFPVSLENSHVIERDQIFVSVVERGPDGEQLSSAFARRFIPENMSSLGRTVANLSRVVPHGLLVFFPSFSVMERTLDFWRANGHADRIETVKPMFVEPRGKGTFNEVMDGYYNKVSDPSSKGGSFFAVCRGKASEGLDFADTFGRGVVITGLPFPPRMDPRVVLKMQFLDEMCRKKAPGVKYLSGQEWYSQQAFRAVNQAIGRVIRHKDDYGAILLCDQRFKSSNARAQLPSWVRPYVRVYSSFGNVIRDLSQFFRVAQKLRPVAEKKGAAGSCEAVCLSAPLSSCSTSCSPSQSSIPQKAKVLDAHLPSLKRRRLNEHSGAAGMARICVEYECELQESQRRPANLLDALERGDHHSAEDEGAAVGEEKCDKRIDDEMRGGKRKIKLVQQQKKSQVSEAVSGEGTSSRVKGFLAEMKKSLSQCNFEQIVQTLQTYKKTDDLDVLLTDTAVLTEDANTYSLLRGLYQFIRPHHKQRFDERCRDLTGGGCGYEPSHSLSVEEKKKALLNSAAVRRPAVGVTPPPSTCSQLNTEQLNEGGLHLSQRPHTAAVSRPAVGVTPPPSTCSQLNTEQLNKGGLHLSQRPHTGSAPKTEAHASFQADVKKAIGAEKTALLLQAIQSYKRSACYEALVGTAVSLFTERDQDFQLLVRFGSFIPPRHKKQYKEMLQALAGQSSSAEVPAVSEDEQASSSPPLKTQSKISSFFSSSQRK